MKTTPAPIRFAGSHLGDARHVCAFFDSREEGYRVLLPFIDDGFRCGDKAVHVVNPGERTDHMARLAELGIDVDAVEASGQLEVRTNTDIYLRDGVFDKERMLEAFEKMASGSSGSAYPLSRIVCQMDWATENRTHIDDLIEFESRVNNVWQHHDDAVICVYDLAKFGGDMVVDMIRTHPMIVLGGVLHRNPFFMPPEQFLADLHERRQAR